MLRMLARPFDARVIERQLRRGNGKLRITIEPLQSMWRKKFRRRPIRNLGRAMSVEDRGVKTFHPPDAAPFGAQAAAEIVAADAYRGNWSDAGNNGASFGFAHRLVYSLGGLAFEVRLHCTQRLVRDVLDEEAADDAVGERRERRDAKMQHVDNLHQHARGSFLERPDHAHSAGESLQMMKAHLHSGRVDDLLGDPRNGNPGAASGHFDDVTLGAALEIADVAVMGQDPRPLLEIGRGLKDRFPRGLDDDRVAGLHPSRSARQDKPHAHLRNVSTVRRPREFVTSMKDIGTVSLVIAERRSRGQSRWTLQA